MSKCFCHLNGFEVKDATSRKNIETLFNNVNDMNATLQNTISDLDLISDNVDGLNTLTSDTATKVSRMVKPKYILLTDSYGNRLSEKNYFEYFMEYSGIDPKDCIMYCNSGAGFSVEGNSFLGLLQIKEQIVADKSAITHIVVCGGSNDNKKDETLVRNSIAEFCSYSKEAFPNANIYIGYIGWSWKPTEDYHNTLAIYRDCNLYGAYYLNNIEFTLHRRTMMMNKSETDYIHPSEEGIQALGKNLAQCLKTGSCDVFYMHQQFIDTQNDSSKALIFVGRVKAILHNEITQLSVTEGGAGQSGLWVLKASKQTFKEGAVYEICDLSQYMPLFSHVNHTNQIIVPYKIPSLNNMLGYGAISVANNKLIFRVTMTPQEISTDVGISIPAINYTIATMMA